MAVGDKLCNVIGEEVEAILESSAVGCRHSPPLDWVAWSRHRWTSEQHRAPPLALRLRTLSVGCGQPSTTEVDADPRGLVRFRIWEECGTLDGRSTLPSTFGGAGVATYDVTQHRIEPVEETN